MHVLDEILAERDEEQYSEEASEHGAQEHLPEIDLEPEYVDGRKREDGSGDDHARAGAYALDYHVLPQAALLAEGAGHADGDDCDGDGGLEHLTDLEAEIRRGGREQDSHQQAEGHGIRGDLKGFLFRTQEGPVALPRLQFPVGVLRQA